MKILVACEESQAVTIEFRKRGHEAYSCDLVDCSGGHPEWHLKQDVRQLLSYDWDMIVAFPPCTHLASSGAKHFDKKREDGRQREAIEFFGLFLLNKCPKIAIENPVGIISGTYLIEHFGDLCKKYGIPRKPNQIIHPWMFGDNVSKSTCLWLKNLPPLRPEVAQPPELEWKEWIDQNGAHKRQSLWFYDALIKAKSPAERACLRSKTFPGIARAMAEQWG